MRIDFSTIKGFAVPEGKVTQIADASGNVLWALSGGWPDDLDTGLEFTSASPFNLETLSVGWNGTIEYCNGGGGWKTWDGSEISSGESEKVTVSI